MIQIGEDNDEAEENDKSGAGFVARDDFDSSYGCAYCVNQAAITASGDNPLCGGIIGFGLVVFFDKCVNESGIQISVTSHSAETTELETVVGGIAGTVFARAAYNCANFASVTVSTEGGQPAAPSPDGQARVSRPVLKPA